MGADLWEISGICPSSRAPDRVPFEEEHVLGLSQKQTRPTHSGLGQMNGLMVSVTEVIGTLADVTIHMVQVDFSGGW